MERYLNQKRENPVKRLLCVTLLLSLAATVGCGDDDSNNDSNNGSSNNGSSNNGSSNNGTSNNGTSNNGSSNNGTNNNGASNNGENYPNGRPPALPATEEMTAGAGSTIASAHLCQYKVFGGYFGFNLSGGGFSSCPGASKVLSFYYDSNSMEYFVDAGEFETDITDINSVVMTEISSVSAGTLTDGTPDRVTDIPGETDVTVSIQNWDITFQMSPETLTISGFDAQ